MQKSDLPAGYVLIYHSKLCRFVKVCLRPGHGHDMRNEKPATPFGNCDTTNAKIVTI